MKAPTKTDFEAWQANPVTEAVMALLNKQAADIRAQWSDGMNWTDESRFQVMVRESMAALSYDELKELIEDHFGDEADE